jgi:hypothetical protein
VAVFDVCYACVRVLNVGCVDNFVLGCMHLAFGFSCYMSFCFLKGSCYTFYNRSLTYTFRLFEYLLYVFFEKGILLINLTLKKFISSTFTKYQNIATIGRNNNDIISKKKQTAAELRTLNIILSFKEIFILNQIVSTVIESLSMMILPNHNMLS